MDKLIPFINEIHDILYQSNLANILEMPQIVVIGAQSVGKSSVLESIMGRDFLPRGKGIVTRRPIEIQLINLKQQKDQREYVEFIDKPGEKIYDLNEVKQFIDQSTENICGKNKDISNVPIKLKYGSPTVVDLMLVDLPGITKNPVGEQPKDIERKILDLIMPYIKNKNSLILAVSKGNDDLANSESLKLAREVDPQGLRTLGVITQLDVMDEGTDVMNDIMNKTYPLKLGYVGIVCRGHKDVQQRKNLEQQIEDERTFFMNHKSYQKVMDKMGTPYLVKTLNYSFIQHIKRSLPKIRENIIEQIQLKDKDLKLYGDFDIQKEQNKGLYTLKLLSDFSDAFSEQIKGQYIKNQNEELLAGARINYILFDIFRNSIINMDPFDILKDDDIRTAIKNSNGLKSSLFIPEMAFENLVKQQIMRLQNPCLECSQYVYEELRKILYSVNIAEIERFENLRNSIFNVMEEVLNKCLQPTNMMIKNLIQIEMGYVNVNHPDFLGATGALMNISSENNQDNQQSDLEQALKNDSDKKKDRSNLANSSNINSISNNINNVNNNLNNSAISNGSTFWEKINPFGKSQQTDNQDESNKNDKSSNSENKLNYNSDTYQNSYLVDKYYNSSIPIQNIPSVYLIYQTIHAISILLNSQAQYRLLKYNIQLGSQCDSCKSKSQQKRTNRNRNDKKVDSFVFQCCEEKHK